MLPVQNDFTMSHKIRSPVPLPQKYTHQSIPGQVASTISDRDTLEHKHEAPTHPARLGARAPRAYTHNLCVHGIGLARALPFVPSEGRQ